MGRATEQLGIGSAVSDISIHALRGEGDTAQFISKISSGLISIHALRGEGDATTIPAP